LDIGPFELSDEDSFLVDIPGFIGENGVVSATVAQEKRLESAMSAVLALKNGSAVLAGIAETSFESSSFAIVDGCLRAGFKLNKNFPVGSYRFKLRIAFGNDPLRLLSAYGDYLAQFSRTQEKIIPVGWNSWDFYGAAVAMNDIEKEMEALGALECREKVKYITIDMGWEESWGDWIPNRKFPKELKTIAAKIRDTGFKPGIWLAPLQVSMYTRLARFRQNLFLRDETGALIIESANSPVGPVLLLDYKLAEVRKLVGGWFRNLRESGFELFKIDYLYTAFLSLQENSLGGIIRIAFSRLI
jgi:alpha-galactosidase